MGSRILVLGAGVFQVPVITLARQLGHYVITMDYLPDNPGHMLANERYIVSTREKEKCYEVAKGLSIDAVLTAASDVAVPTVAYIGKKLGLPAVNLNAAETLSNKGNFRKFLRDNGLNTPKFIVSDNYDDLHQFFNEIKRKCIIKPLDSSGSKGIAPICDAGELRRCYTAIQGQFGDCAVCLEEFIEGIEVGGDAFCIDGKPEFIMVTKKSLTPPPYYVPTGHIVPGDIYEKRPDTVEGIRRELYKIFSLLEVSASPANFDVMIDNDGVIFVIDIGLRTGGNCIPDIIWHCCGIDLYRATIDASLGNRSEFPTRAITRHVGSRILGSPRDGIISSHEDPGLLKKKYDNLIEIKYDYEPGGHVRRFTQGNYRIGHIIASANTISLLEKSLDDIEQDARIIVE
ncbi:MAG TPA: ATP-grasp domain-containing protein [Spirochaetota bacterium]|nr:ATP-grasp domain-containing protein [Spirochaetota bacterium]HPN14186.1 ATP-grasp domain-containing protein [Spirochaetota bacterium]